MHERDTPSLAGRPFAVGGVGMISTASYAARRFGVRSAMPGFIGQRLCPGLLFVPPDFLRYEAAAEAVRGVLRDFDPRFSAASLDEAALDVTDYCAASGLGGAEVAALLRRRVHEATGLTASAGVAPNALLAKIASDVEKPNGQHVVPAERGACMAFMGGLEVRKVPGIGRVMQHVLAALGVATGADVLARRGLLAALFSPAALDFFLRSALGLGPTEHAPAPAPGEVGRSSVSRETPFPAVSAAGELESLARQLAARVADDLAGEGLQGRTVTLKLKLTSFEVRVRWGGKGGGGWAPLPWHGG